MKANSCVLAKHLKVKDFRLAEEERMIELLGVERGCATPMALWNDKEHIGSHIFAKNFI